MAFPGVRSYLYDFYKVDDERGACLKGSNGRPESSDLDASPITDAPANESDDAYIPKRDLGDNIPGTGSEAEFKKIFKQARVAPDGLGPYYRNPGVTGRAVQLESGEQSPCLNCTALCEGDNRDGCVELIGYREKYNLSPDHPINYEVHSSFDAICSHVQDHEVVDTWRSRGDKFFPGICSNCGIGMSFAHNCPLCDSPLLSLLPEDHPVIKPQRSKSSYGKRRYTKPGKLKFLQKNIRRAISRLPKDKRVEVIQSYVQPYEQTFVLDDRFFDTRWLRTSGTNEEADTWASGYRTARKIGKDGRRGFQKKNLIENHRIDEIDFISRYEKLERSAMAGNRKSRNKLVVLRTWMAIKQGYLLKEIARSEGYSVSGFRKFLKNNGRSLGDNFI